MVEQYVHEGIIVKVQYYAYQGEVPPHEGNLILKFEKLGKSYLANCFVDGDNVAILVNRKVSEGSLIRFSLYLLNYDYDKPTGKLDMKKKFVERSDGSYDVSGVIVDLRNHPSYEDSLQAIVDSGPYVYTRIKKGIGLKIGDYLAGRGRLDDNIIGKVK